MVDFRKLRGDWQKAKAIAEASTPIFIPTLRGVKPTRATRRLMKLSLRHRTKLRREKHTHDLLVWATAREVRRREKEVERAKRKHRNRHPTLRVRSKQDSKAVKAPTVLYYVNGKLTKVTDLYYTWGVNQGFTDYKPVQHPDPPRRNAMWAQKLVQNATSCSFSIEGKSGPYAISARFPKGKWALGCLDFWNIPTEVSQPLSYDDGVAQQALQTAIGKIKDADIAFSEYTAEGIQVLRLLVDPFRSIKKIQRTLERWTRRDAWIWIPPTTARRFGNGVLVSRVPLGGVLMSLRTRRTLDLERASANLIDAAANRWLQYRYGIMPLIKDVTTIIGGLADRPCGTGWKVRGARVWVSSQKEFATRTKTWSIALMSAKCAKHTGVYYTAKQFYKLDRTPPLSYVLGVHPTQWNRALWNILPYSFVADWFINVDRWLLACINMPGLKLGPNMVTAKSFTSATALVTGATFTGTVKLPAVFTNLPVARTVHSKVFRKVDIEPTNGAILSSNWTKCKNLFTGAALLLQLIARR